MNKFEELKALIGKCQEESDEFYNKQNKAAGVRLRKYMQDVRQLAKEIRDDISNKTKQIPKNPKKIKTIK